jgi:ATP-dependent protease HslVU (ClpYQ) peptidase subunit
MRSYRRKKKKMKNMKKIILTVLVTAGMLTGCLGRGGISGSASQIYITSEGGLQTETVEKYEKHDYYNSDELKSYVEEKISDYNKSHGDGAVVLATCTMENGKATMKLNYNSGENLVEFAKESNDTANQVDSIAVDLLSQKLEQIETEGVTFVKTNGKQADKEALLKKGECHVAVVETQNPVTLQTQGKILFISDKVEVKNGHTATLAQGKNYIIFK